MNIKEAHNYLGRLLTQGIDPNTALIIPDKNEWCCHTEVAEIRAGYYEYVEQVADHLPTRRPYKGLGLMLVTTKQLHNSSNFTLVGGITMRYKTERTDVPVRGPGIEDKLWSSDQVDMVPTSQPGLGNPLFVSFILEVDGLAKLPIILTVTDKIKDDIRAKVNRLVIGDSTPTIVRSSVVTDVVDFIMSDWVGDKVITYKMGICTVTAVKGDEAPVVEFIDGKPTFKA